MSQRRIVFCLLIALNSAAFSPAFAQAASPEGHWVTRDFVIHISRCNSGLCGELVGLDKRAAAGLGRLDVRNSDRTQRERRLCGMDVFGGFQASAESGKWQGGWIYNPEDGRTYKSEMRLIDADTIKARGYVLAKLFGRNVTLTRETAPVRRCAVEQASSTG